jgi:hypothetical protein
MSEHLWDWLYKRWRHLDLSMYMKRTMMCWIRRTPRLVVEGWHGGVSCLIPRVLPNRWVKERWWRRGSVAIVLLLLLLLLLLTPLIVRSWRLWFHGVRRTWGEGRDVL